MQCATCGNDNLPQARFCARCGSVLAEVASSTPTPPLAQPSPLVAGDQGKVRISAVTPVIAMLLAGLILSVMARPVYYYYYGSYYGSAFAIAFTWVWAVAGVVAAFWLVSRLRLEGRLPSALGMILVALGSFIGVGSSWVGNNMGVGWSMAVGVASVANCIIGLGVGLAMPPIFWRLLPSKSVGAKVALVVAAVTGLFLGNWALGFLGFGFAQGVTLAVALLGGLPAALASPTVRVPRHAGDTVSVAAVPARAPRRARSKSLIVGAGTVIFALAAALVVSQSIYNLPGYAWGIVQQFGQIRSVESTGGLHFKIPFVQQVTYLDRGERAVATYAGEYLTSDQKRILVHPGMRWRIVDPLSFFLRLNPKGSVSDRLARLVVEGLRQRIAATPYDVMISADADAIMNKVRDAVQSQVDEAEWGIEVIEISVEVYPTTQ